MTIIQPHKNDKSNFSISILMMCCVIMALWGIFLYNQTINLRHEVGTEKKNVQQAEVANAELKNTFYGITNIDNLKSASNAQSLVMDQNPQYVKLAEGSQAN